MLGEYFLSRVSSTRSSELYIAHTACNRKFLVYVSYIIKSRSIVSPDIVNFSTFLAGLTVPASVDHSTLGTKDKGDTDISAL